MTGTPCCCFMDICQLSSTCINVTGTVTQKHSKGFCKDGSGESAVLFAYRPLLAKGEWQNQKHLIHQVRHFAVKKTSSSLPPRVRTPKGFVTMGVDVWRKNNKWFTVMRGALLTKIMAYLHKKKGKYVASPLNAHFTVCSVKTQNNY